MTILVQLQCFSSSEDTRLTHHEALCKFRIRHLLNHCLHFPSKLVLSVCLAFLISVEGQQTEDNRDNGQGGCQPPFCFNFDHIFDPIGKKIGKINTIIGFKTNKINKVIGFKNAIRNFKDQKLQFEIGAIRTAQSVLDAKLQAK